MNNRMAQVYNEKSCTTKKTVFDEFGLRSHVIKRMFQRKSAASIVNSMFLWGV